MKSIESDPFDFSLIFKEFKELDKKILNNKIIVDTKGIWV